MTQTSIFPYFIIMLILSVFARLISRNSFYEKAIEKSKNSYYKSLDGLRGILALGVFFHHSVINYYYFQTGYFSSTFSRFYDFLGQGAVALFFMMTGFLFWSKAINGKLSLSKSELVKFYTNRFLRIYPLYWLSLTFIIVVAMSISHFSIKHVSSLLYEIFRLSTLLSAVFINGSHGPTSINDISIVPINSGVQWTLVYEVQFYLILPFLAFFSKTRKFLILSGAIILLYAFNPERHIAILINFLCGMLAAYLVTKVDRVKSRVNSWLADSIALLLVVILLLLPEADYVANPAASILLCIIFTLIAAGNTFFGLLTLPSFRYLGIISYSIYLLHGITLFGVFNTINVFHPIRDLSPGSFWLLTAFSGSLVVLISSLTYRFIEYPFLSIKISTNFLRMSKS